MKTKQLIDRALDKYLPSGKIEPEILHKAMRDSVLPGGKRIRPAILIEAAAACGGRRPYAVAAGCAVELVHAYSLIHDDLPPMDNDDYRRGKPSCHKKFGEAIAILAGDSLLTLAFNILASEYPPEKSAEMTGSLSLYIGSLGMAGGQALDIAKNPDRKKVNRLKTACLFEAAAHLGAISAGAGEKKAFAVKKYGMNIGMAFQAADDIADHQTAPEVIRGSTHGQPPGLAAVGYIKRAKAALRIFGKRGDELKRIADSVTNQLASFPRKRESKNGCPLSRA